MKIRSVVHEFRRYAIFAALALLASISSLWSQDPVTSFSLSLFIWVDTLFAYYLYDTFSFEEWLRVLAICGWICFTVSAILAIFFPAFGLEPSSSDGAWRGMYGNKNPCAEMTVLFLIATTYIRARTALLLLNRVLFLSASVFLIATTHSATGEVLLAAFVAHWLISAAIMRINAKGRVYLVIVGVMCLGALSFWVFPNVSAFTESLGKESTLTGRTDIWRVAIIFISKSPWIGYGYRAFWHGVNGESSIAMVGSFMPLHAHNGLLEIWLELGIVGVGLICTAILKALRDYLTCSGDNDRLVNYSACMVIVIGIYSCVESSFMVPNDLAWIILIVASLHLGDARSARMARQGQLMPLTADAG